MVPPIAITSRERLMARPRHFVPVEKNSNGIVSGLRRYEVKFERRREIFESAAVLLSALNYVVATRPVHSLKAIEISRSLIYLQNLK